MADKKGDQNLFLPSTLGIVGGAFIFTMMPVAGGLTVALSALLLYKEFRKAFDPMHGLFRNLGLVNKDGKYPVWLDGNMRKGFLRYSLPPALSLGDFEKCKQAIEQHFDREMTITYKDKNVIIEFTNDTLGTLPDIDSPKK